VAELPPDLAWLTSDDPFDRARRTFDWFEKSASPVQKEAFLIVMRALGAEHDLKPEAVEARLRRFEGAVQYWRANVIQA